MKRILLVLIIIIMAKLVQAQDRTEIIDVMHAQQKAWNNGDIDQFMQSYWKSDSLLFVGKAGPNYGWQTTLGNYKKHYPDKATMGHLGFDILKVNILDSKNAFVLGGWTITRGKDSIGGYFTLWFRRFKDGWKIVADHTS